MAAREAFLIRSNKVGTLASAERTSFRKAKTIPPKSTGHATAPARAAMAVTNLENDSITHPYVVCFIDQLATMKCKIAGMDRSGGPKKCTGVLLHQQPKVINCWVSTVGGRQAPRRWLPLEARKKPGFRPALLFLMDARVKPGHDEREGRRPHNTRLLSFTFSASRYTLLPISLNLALICAMPSSMVPEIDMPTAAGSFSVAA